MPMCLILPSLLDCQFHFYRGQVERVEDVLLQLEQLLHRLLNRRLPVHAVDVQQINAVHAQPLQTPLALLPAVLGRAVHEQPHAAVLAGPHPQAELGGQEDVGAALGVAGKPLAHEFLAVAVHVGRVPVGAAQLPCAVEHGEAVLVGAGWVSHSRSPFSERIKTYLTDP